MQPHLKLESHTDMKKLVIFILFLAAGVKLIAGGLVTNTNQSAMFTRFQCRDATIDIDAAFYNPAGLTHLSRGFYLSVNNQTMGQLKMIKAEYENFGEVPKEFNARVNAPFFPGVYAVLKTGRFAFSAGVNPISGGGSSSFDQGLPALEMKVADILPTLRNNLAAVDQTIESVTGVDPSYSNIVSYDLDYTFEASSVYMGYQANLAFEVNDYISVAAGVRLINAVNKYHGKLEGITVTGTTNTGTFTRDPADYLRTVASDYDTLPTAANLVAIADQIETRTNIETHVRQKGIGFTPVLSFNYAASLRTNIAIKLELKTKLELETEVIDGENAGGGFTDGNIVIADIPAMLSIGITRRPLNKILIYSGIHYYFDKPIDFDGSALQTIDMIDNNSYEFAIGTEYELNDAVRLSLGWLITRPGVNSEYQNAGRFKLRSNSLGGGLGIRISPLIDINLGASYTLYKKDSRKYSRIPDDGVDPLPVTEYYDTRTWILSAGIDFLFGENK